MLGVLAADVLNSGVIYYQREPYGSSFVHEEAGSVEDQIELGEEGLDERNHYPLEVNLEDLESTIGEEQHYWLLQIQAARSERALRESNQNSNNGRGSRERGGA